MFKLGTDGSGFATLHNFSYTSDIQPFNSDGITPLVGLALSGNTLYGTAYLGGTGANGTVFSVGTNGTSFQTLHSFTAFGTGPFTNSDGATPISDLVVVGNVIYGSTSGGGPTGVGTLFRMNTNGSAFGIFNNLTNIVGGEPLDVTFSNNVLYGATAGGGDFNNGTIFRIGVDGTGLTVLYSFTGRNDGAQPAAGVLLSGEVLFGTTHVGGASGQGTVFKLNLDGSGFATLHSFTTNEGTPNWGRLVLVGHNLFGIASYGLQGGTVYTLGTNGTGFTILHTFSGGNDGGLPKGGLVSSGTTLYGTTSAGGAFGSGTVFSLSLLPNLAIVPRGQNVVLTWPTNYAGIDYTGYALQSATNLGPEAIWTTNLPAPVVINGQNTVTNPVSLTQQFFRLSQ